MISRQSALNYAKALFHVRGSSEEIHLREENLDQLAEIIRNVPEMIHLLNCPDLSSEAKISLLEKALGKRLDQHVNNLLSLLLGKGKAVLIRQIAAEYHKLVVYSLKELDIELASAAPLSEEAKRALLQKLEKKYHKKVNFIEKVDPALLGGFTLLVHNQMLDLTMRGKLLNLKKQLLKAKI